MWGYSLDKKYFHPAGETRESAIEAATKEIQSDLDEYRRRRGNPDLMFVDGPVYTVYVGEFKVNSSEEVKITVK